MRFEDRRDAGRRLAEALTDVRAERPVVLGLPRGGVPVAAEVARALGAPLDVILVRKLGVPSRPELAMGAIGEGDVRVLNESVMRLAGVTGDRLETVEAREREELASRARRFRRDRQRLPLAGRTVVVVDDGLATGATARAALRVARVAGARRVVLAVPVAPPDTVRKLAGEADTIVCLTAPPEMYAVGQWYDDFGQTSDDEVAALLDEAAAASELVEREVEIPVDPMRLPGTLTVPRDAAGLVVFAHGSGSSRLSARNRVVAGALHAHALGTLLFDLLAPAEADDPRNVFDVALLAARLRAATRWVLAEPIAQGVPLGYFGASTGAAAALWAAAEPSSHVAAVVSRGGRPDLARERLDAVRAPTLLIVGGADTEVLELNRAAAQRLHAEHRLEVVPGATHLFEEPGALDTVARLATGWFVMQFA